MTTVLAIDQGTSGTKAIVVDATGTILGLAEVPVRPAYLPGGGVEQDPDGLLSSVLDAGRSAAARAGCSIDIVTLANQGESVLAWDPKTGRPLSPVIVWQDRRAERVCARLADHGDSIARRTGLALDPYFTAPKMVWLRENVTREGVVTTTDTWLLHCLTREFVTDVTTASRSLLLDVDTLSWDDELLRVFGLSDERLPRIVASDELIGTTTVFGGRIPVGGLVVDQQAALVAQRCLHTGEMKCTFGTGAFLLANAGPSRIGSASGLATSVAWKTRRSTAYCLDGQVYAAASAVRWIQDLGLIGSAADLDQISADDANGVLSVPAFVGLAAPWWRPDATAAFSGITLSTGRGHLVLAVLEGIAAQVAELGDLIAQDLDRPLSRLRVDGGLTRSRRLMQAVADLMQVELEVYPSPHATPLGAAALARVTADPGLSLEEAVHEHPPSRTYTPRWSAERTRSFRAEWRAAASAAAERNTK